MRIPITLLLSLCELPALARPQTPVTPHPVRAKDLLRLRAVTDPQLSPDGNWVAYTVTSADTAKDKTDADIWMTSWDGTQTVRVTSTPENETSPRWSPDGRWLAFLSGRQEGKGAQVWLLDRRGGEAQRITTVKDGVSALRWSPDSKRLALIGQIDLDTAKRDTTKARPIVITRYHFKEDIDGYLTTTRTHLLLLDVATKKIDTVTTGAASDDDPRWSPDGARLAFIRTTHAEPGTGQQTDLFVVDARAGATLVRLTTQRGPNDGPPAWSPDGKWIAFLRGDDPKFYAYQELKLTIAASDGSAPPRIVTEGFDRSITGPVFTADGASILAHVADDRRESLVRVRVADGTVERIIEGRQAVLEFSTANTAPSKIAVLLATPDRAPEVFAFEAGAMRQLSHQNDSLFAELAIAPSEDLTSRSADGAEVHSIVVRPAGTQAAQRLPTIFYIHGGPKGQDGYQFSFDRQLFAANGYAVVSVNYRGSDGRGLAWQRAIFADWGHKEVLDILGAADEAVRAGIADSARLAIGGWSYGGILTDYTIATTTRFKAAVSGAGSALQLSYFGSDEYIEQYELELGPPWKSKDLWLKLSYPFFQADKIRTPTLFLGGQADFNVPIIGGEQMYQALRLTGVPTELVIYPGQFHGLTVPSFRLDYRERFLAWCEKYLKQGGPVSKTK